MTRDRGTQHNQKRESIDGIWRLAMLATVNCFLSKGIEQGRFGRFMPKSN